MHIRALEVFYQVDVFVQLLHAFFYTYTILILYLYYTYTILILHLYYTYLYLNNTYLNTDGLKN